MKLLITGGCGFIGSNFIRYMFKKNPSYKIVNLDKLTYCGNLCNLDNMENDKHCAFVKGDICDRKIADKMMKGCDAVIHFAAESHGDPPISKPS